MPTHEGGTEWELEQAERAIAAAGTDMVALAQAQRRHADAIRNMMQGVIVPMFVEMVERVLAGKIDPVTEAIHGLRTDVQSSAQDVAARLGKTEVDIEALQVRVDTFEDIRVWRAAVDVRLADIEQADRDDIRAEIKDIKAALARYEAKHQELTAKLEGRRVAVIAHADGA